MEQVRHKTTIQWVHTGVGRVGHQEDSKCTNSVRTGILRYSSGFIYFPRYFSPINTTREPAESVDVLFQGRKGSSQPVKTIQSTEHSGSPPAWEILRP